MMVMDQRVSCVIGNPPRAAITSPERSKWRSAKLTYTGTARSFPTSFPSQLRSRTVTSRNACTKVVRAELVANKVDETWANSTWAKRMAIKAKRAGLTDLDRFKLRKTKSARNKILAKALNSKK